MSLPVALFDRLLDEAISPRESVRRELGRLFDVRAGTGPGFGDAQGLPEWRGINASDEEAMRRFCRQLRAAIMQAEPRIVALTVQVTHSRYLDVQLRLEAELWRDAAPMHLNVGYRHGGWQVSSSAGG